MVDVEIITGERASPAATADLLVEVPHGATTTADYMALAGQLASPLPPSLIDFFYVNTDAGAPELALATARRFVAAEPTRTAAVLLMLMASVSLIDMLSARLRARLI